MSGNWRVLTASLTPSLWNQDGKTVEWQASYYDDDLEGTRFNSMDEADVALWSYYIDSGCQVEDVTAQYIGVVQNGGDVYWLLTDGEEDEQPCVISLQFFQDDEE